MLGGVFSLPLATGSHSQRTYLITSGLHQTSAKACEETMRKKQPKPNQTNHCSELLKSTFLVCFPSLPLKMHPKVKDWRGEVFCIQKSASQSSRPSSHRGKPSEFASSKGSGRPSKAADVSASSPEPESVEALLAADSDVTVPHTLPFKTSQLEDRYPRGQTRGRWKNLKQILQAENVNLLPLNEPTCECHLASWDWRTGHPVSNHWWWSSMWETSGP